MTAPEPKSIPPRRRGVVAVLAAAWVVAFALSFVLAALTAPAGDGLARGWNRVGVFLGWQAAAIALALVTWIAGIGQFRQTAGWRWLSRTPLMVELAFAALIAALISYVSWQGRVQRPQEMPPATPTKATGAAMTARLSGNDAVG